jgi:hypothetical protein
MRRVGFLLVLLLACLALYRNQFRPVAGPFRVDGRAVVAMPAEASRQGVAPDIPIGATADPTTPAESTQVPADLIDVGRLAMHAIDAAQPCLAGTARAARADKVAVHRWVDDAGIVHFSDQLPEQGRLQGYRRIEVDGMPPVVVHASGYDVNLPDQLAQRAIADTLAIARVLRDSLGVEGDPGLVLTIEFLGSAQSYARRIGNPAMAASDGTYASADRTIRIRLQNDIEANFRILRHEIAHALIHERIGQLPTTLNEGLAGYFERFQVSGLGAQVSVEGSMAALKAAEVSGNGEDELVDLLARDGTMFYGAGREQRYVRAYALVAVLMGTPAGRNGLSAVLSAQRGNPCLAVDVARLLEESYPGGLRALAVDWSRWIRDPPATVQAF